MDSVKPNSPPLEEAAVSSREAISQRLALFVPKDQGSSHAMLIDYPGTIQMLQKQLPGAFRKSQGNSVFALDHLEVTINECLKKNIVGYLKFRRAPAGSVSPKDRAEAFVVELASANSGFGPLMYDLAMSLVFPRYLMADRNSVSRSAFGVWQYYLTNRTGDVSRVPLEGVQTGKTELPDATSSKASRATWELTKINSEIENVQDELGFNDRDHYETQALKKELEKLLKKKANREAAALAAIQQDPMAWKFKIKKPIGTARLSENGNKLREGILQAILAEPSGKGILSPADVKHSLKDIFASGNFFYIGEDFFESKYGG